MIRIIVTRHQSAIKILWRSGSKHQRTLISPKSDKIPTINQREMVLERRRELRRRTHGKEAPLVLQFSIEMGHATRLTSIQFKAVVRLSESTTQIIAFSMARASAEKIEPKINGCERKTYLTKANQGKGDKIKMNKKDYKMETKKR